MGGAGGEAGDGGGFVGEGGDREDEARKLQDHLDVADRAQQLQAAALALEGDVMSANRLILTFPFQAPGVRLGGVAS